MAEAAGLIFGLAPIFNTALEWFHLIRVSKEFGTDFETCQLQLDLLGLQLSRWGESIGLNNAKSPDDVELSKSDMDKVCKVLNQVNALFQKAERQSDQLKDTGSVSERPSRTSGITDMMHQLTIGRRNAKYKDKVTTKAKWALYKRDELTSLITSIGNLVNQLVDVYSPKSAKIEQHRLCQEEAIQLAQVASEGSEALKILQGAVEKQDTMLSKTLDAAIAKNAVEPPISSVSATFSGANNRGLQMAQNNGEMKTYFGGASD